MVIAFDFDNTIIKWKQGGVFYPVKYVVDFLKHRKMKNDILILWTCREGEDLEWAVQICKDWGILLDYVNENTKEVVDSGRNPRKIEADLYIDEKCLNHVSEWHKLKDLLWDDYV